jgi:hypothetical protein
MNDTVKINVTRSFVCMADDALGANRIEFSFPLQSNILELVSKIDHLQFLPPISGGEATWLVYNSNKAIALIAQQWDSPKFFINEQESISTLYRGNTGIDIFLDYKMQLDPSRLYNAIKAITVN